MYIPLSDCKVRSVYSLNSRNLKFGVFTTSNTFIGIRNKFDYDFLDHELHYERRGTAFPLEKIGEIPEKIELVTSLGTYDTATGKDVKFDKPVSDGGKGWYFIDDEFSSLKIMPCRKANFLLFNYLKKISFKDKEIIKITY